MFPTLVVALLVSLVSCSEASVVVGRRTEINYNSECGTWNDPVTESGKILNECCPVDATYPGSPWQQLSLSYVQDGVVSHFSGNTASGCTDYTVVTEEVLEDRSGVVGIVHVLQMGLVTLTKREEWHYKERELLITFKVKFSDQDSCKPITNLTVMHAVDPDQDREPFLTFMTLNDVIYDGGTGLYAEAVGPRSCKGMGYGICSKEKQDDGSQDAVGFTQWQSITPAVLNDPDGQIRDDTLHYQHTEDRPLFCGDEREFIFFVVWGKCHREAREGFLKAHGKYCKKCHPPPPPDWPPFPRCDGQCPCNSDLHNCTCTYMCPTCVPVPHSYRDVSTTEVIALLAGCSPMRKKRQVGGPELININFKRLTPEECQRALVERNFYANPPVLNTYYCPPAPTTMQTYYRVTTMGTYYDTTTTPPPNTTTTTGPFFNTTTPRLNSTTMPITLTTRTTSIRNSTTVVTDSPTRTTPELNFTMSESGSGSGDLEPEPAEGMGLLTEGMEPSTNRRLPAEEYELMKGMKAMENLLAKVLRDKKMKKKKKQ